MTQDPNETVMLTLRVSTLYALMNVLDVTLPSMDLINEGFDSGEGVTPETIQTAATGFDELVDMVEAHRGVDCWVVE